MTTSHAPRVLLISLRDPHDAMAWHEHRCFADCARLPHDQLDVHFMSTGPLDPSTLSRYDAVFFGGSGAYSVLDDILWIRQGMEALLRVVEARVPSWASCFGFQGLAIALGGEVIRDDERTEMGSTLLHLTEEGHNDVLTQSLPKSFWGQEGHHDRVSIMPAGVVRLCYGDVCEEQGFRVDGAPFWASQFHPELQVRTTVDRFKHYRAHYFEGPSEEADAVIASLSAGAETPEVSELLALLVRGGFE